MTDRDPFELVHEDGLLADLLPDPLSFFGHHEEEARPPLHGLQAGKTFGDFRLVALLGEGGMGQVWEAEQLSLGKRRVALKVVRPDRLGERQRAYFEREARAGARLTHPHIAAIHGYGEHDGLAWISMELVEGTWSLRDFLDEMGRREALPVRYDLEVAVLVRDVAQAMQAAHEAGVIHRDIKPQNILISPDGHPKITDFGLARITDEAALSQSGDIAGTYLYMSPEQVAGSRRDVDHRTDVFSLGVVLYEMLALTRPFQGDTSQQIAYQITMQEPPSLDSVRSRIPRDLIVICSKALEKDPRSRYATMGDFAADLGRFLAHEPILARPPGTAERLRKWIRRHPARSLAGSVAGLAFVATSAALLLYVKTNEELRETVAENERVIGEEALARAEAESQRDIANDTTRYLAEIFSVANPHENPEAFGAAELLRTGLERLDDPERGLMKPETRAPVLLALGESFAGLGLYREARDTLRRALEAHSQAGARAAGAEVLVRNLYRLAEAEAQLEDLQSAEAHLIEACALSEREFGSESHTTIRARQELADFTLVHQRRYGRALELLLELQPLIERDLQADPHDVLHLLDSLGTAYGGLGRHSDSVRAHRRSLEGHLLQAPPPSCTGIVQGSLAFAYQRLGDLEAAEHWYRESLAFNRVRFGESSYNSGISLVDLASFLAENRRSREAIRLYEQGVDALGESLGASNAFVLSKRVSLAAARIQEGDETAWAELKDGVERLLSHPGAGPSLGVALSELGNVTTSPAEALVYHDLSFAAELGRGGAALSRSITSLDSIAQCLVGLGEPEAASNVLWHALQLVERIPDHLVQEAWLWNELGELTREAGTDVDAALAFYRTGLELLPPSAEPEPFLCNNLALLERRTGNGREAEAVRCRGIAASGVREGKPSAIGATLLVNHAVQLEEEKRFLEADAYYDAALNCALTLYGPGDGEVVHVALYYADMHEQLGDHTAARSVLTEALGAVMRADRTPAYAEYDLLSGLLDVDDSEEGRDLLLAALNERLDRLESTEPPDSEELARARFFCGFLESEVGDSARAVELLEAQVEVVTDRGLTAARLSGLDELGLALARSGDVEQALQVVSTALSETAPDDPLLRARTNIVGTLQRSVEEAR